MNKEKAKALLTQEFLYISAFSLIVFCSFYDTTTFKELLNLKPLHMVARVYLAIALSYKCLWLDKYKKQDLIKMAVILFVSAIAVLLSRRGALFDYVLLLVGARNINPKKILKAYLVIAIPLIVLAFLCSNFGLIENFTIKRRGSTSIRNSFGIVYPTDFAAHIFYIILSLLYIKKRKMQYYDVLIILLIVILLDKFCNARTSEVMILLTGILFFVLDYKEKIFNNKIFPKVVKAFSGVLALTSIFLPLLYSTSNEIIVLIDEKLLNGRFFMAKRVIDMYGYSLFGQKIVMQGDGYKTYQYDANLGKTYIDSAYLQIALLYGFVFLVLLLIAISIYIDKSYKKGDIKMILVIFLILCSCFHNQYLIIIAYNPFTIMMGTSIFGGKNPRNTKRESFKE